MVLIPNTNELHKTINHQKKWIYSKIFFVILLLNSSILVSNASNEDETIWASWKNYPVVIDGRHTNGFEWSECHKYYYKIGANDGIEAPFSSLAIWVKNDSDYLYVLYMMYWPDTGFDASDQGFLYYLWMTQDGAILNNNSDAAWVRLYGASKDMCNYSSGEWVLDSDLGGTSDIIGYGRYDGLAYWFEFKKKLNSTDGLDWVFQPDQVIGATYSPPIATCNWFLG